jgi:hypothetical protein
VDYFLLSINVFHWLQATVARGFSTDELIMLFGVQLLIFAVVYAVWGPYGHFHQLAQTCVTGCHQNYNKATYMY